MSEREPIRGRGIPIEEREPGRLYLVRMPNGHQAIAVTPRGGPAAPDGIPFDRLEMEVAFSPYDMSRCKITRWLKSGNQEPQN
jgi:hypothetical protein